MAPFLRQRQGVGRLMPSGATDPRRLRRVFALCNLAPALLLGVGCWALPLRWWVMDVPVSIVVFGLVATSALSLYDERRAPRLLRVAAITLLGLGLILLALFVLSIAFLSGIHGPFAAFGMILMGLVVLMLLPYAVIYPCAELWWLHQLERARRALPEPASPGPALPADGSAA